jgi:FAD/FMN-containing dehydrogenase
MPFDVPNLRIENCEAPNYIRVGWMRSVANVYHAFGIGSFADELARAARCLKAVFSAVIELGGTLSGEHGVGLEKRDLIAREIDPVTLRLMWDIKRQFDPNGILNPGKSLPRPDQPAEAHVL